MILSDSQGRLNAKYNGVVNRFEFAVSNSEYSQICSILVGMDVEIPCYVWCLFVLDVFSCVSIRRVQPISTEFYSMFLCCAVTPHSKLEEGWRFQTSFHLPLFSQKSKVKLLSLVYVCHIVTILYVECEFAVLYGVSVFYTPTIHVLILMFLLWFMLDNVLCLIVFSLNSY